MIWDDPRDTSLIDLPDGLPREGVVYHVEEISFLNAGFSGVFIAGLRGRLKNLELPWCASSFARWRHYVTAPRKTMY